MSKRNYVIMGRSVSFENESDSDIEEYVIEGELRLAIVGDRSFHEINPIKTTKRFGDMRLIPLMRQSGPEHTETTDRLAAAIREVNSELDTMFKAYVAADPLQLRSITINLDLTTSRGNA